MGGASTNLTINGDYGYFRRANDGRIVVDTATTYQGFIKLFAAGGGTSVNLAIGFRPSFNCTGTMVMFQKRDPVKRGNSPTSILRYDLGTGSTSTFSTSDRSGAEYLCD